MGRADRTPAGVTEESQRQHHGRLPESECCRNVTETECKLKTRIAAQNG